MLKFTLAEIAKKIGGDVAPEHADIMITGLASADDAVSGDLTFFGNPKYLKKVQQSAASAVLVPAELTENLPQPCVRVANPSFAFSQLLEQFSPPEIQPQPGIHPSAVIGEQTQIPSSCHIGANTVIERGAQLGENCVVRANVTIGENARLGDECEIHSGVQIREHCVLGDRVIVHCGAVIGSDGFGFELVEGRHKKIPQRGIVQIDSDVEIGANTAIDRARFGRTWIQEGVKIDNLVQVAHNVVIGKHSIVVSQAGISGSSKLGQYVTLAGQVGVVGHLEIGDQAIVAAQSGVSKSVAAGQVVFGSPAQPMGEAKRSLAHISRLPKMLERIRQLEQRLEQLEQARE